MVSPTLSSDDVNSKVEGTSADLSTTAHNLHFELGVPQTRDCLLDLIQSPPIGEITPDDLVASSHAQICHVPPTSHNLFKSVRHLYVNDRATVTEERRKNLGLMAYISSLGHSIQDVNSFLLNDDSTTTRLVNDFVTIVPIISSRPTVRRITSSTPEIESQNPLGLGQRSDIGCVEGFPAPPMASVTSSIDNTSIVAPLLSVKDCIVENDPAITNNMGGCNLFVNSPKRDNNVSLKDIAAPPPPKGTPDSPVNIVADTPL